MNHIMLMQRGCCLVDSRVEVPTHEIECGDGHIQVLAPQGNLSGVEMLPQGSWDQLNKDKHQATSKVMQYAQECPKGLRAEDTDNPRFKKVVMLDFLELFELEQTEFCGVRHVKVVGRFARSEKRKSGVHFKLQFRFEDGHSITVAFCSKRACMQRGQQAQERRALRQAYNKFVVLNPSSAELQTLREHFEAAIDRINQQREENVDEETCSRKRPRLGPGPQAVRLSM